MKKIRISTLLLAMALFTMSMGFPYKSSGEQAAAKSAKIQYTFAGFMSCSVQQEGDAIQRLKPIVKDCTKTEDGKGKLTSKIASQSASLLVSFIKEKR